MVERAPNAIPGLRMSAEEFNRLRMSAPNGELRKIDTRDAIAKTEFTAEPEKVALNPTWPWLPPGFHGEDSMLHVPVRDAWGAGTSRARMLSGAELNQNEDLVSIQISATPHATMVVGDAQITTLFLSKTAARALAAQLLNEAK